MLSQLASGIRPDRVVTKTDLGQWYLIVFFLRKIILAKTQYKTHNNKFLIIIKAFKTWHYHLKGYKHETLILINHNNSCCFMDTKSLSSRQVH